MVLSTVLIKIALSAGVILQLPCSPETCEKTNKTNRTTDKNTSPVVGQFLLPIARNHLSPLLRIWPLLALLLEAAGLDNDASDSVRVAVRAGPPVLEVAVASRCHIPGNPDGSASMCDASREVVNGGGLVKA